QLTRRFFGWVSYTLSQSERRDATTGRFRLFNLDQPHNFIGVASYKLPKDFILGTRVRYSSGTLDTPVAGAVYDANANAYISLPGEPFSRRLPAFFALDIRLDKRFVYQDWVLTLYADVQNVTNRRNVEGVTYNFDFTEQAYVRGLPILPAIGVRGDF
ncbi:MAG TPA: ligand-gated channel protein, partial [Myxococcaceae bacterium]|nr:ligand-gated channel protein [Myxococcaceae bacterium]